ncbi:RNA ligase [Candidatus Poriferisocius sp.]|uniref:RNA ligase n=1 Tax=Candidatus Poriferisocius sp. TaxID=3101276 RepID=UPI003B5B1026
MEPSHLGLSGVDRRPHGRVLARPFPKFFTPSEPCAPAVPAEGTMHVSDKWDGSLGIAYQRPDGGVRISTRGSLESEQAIEGTRILQERYATVEVEPGVTPLFEIVYPQNRIVVNHGEMRDLVLLSVIDIATGTDLPLDRFDWPGPMAASREFASLNDLADHMARPRPDHHPEEGFVVRYDTGDSQPHIRFKMKWPAYVEQHRVATGLNRRHIWTAAAVFDANRRGISPKDIAARLRLPPETVTGLLDQPENPIEAIRSVMPEEFHGWIDGTLATVTAEARERISLHERLTEQVADESRGQGDREFAEAAQRLAAHHDLPVGPIFALHKQKPEAHLAIWADLRPPADPESGPLTSNRSQL